MNSLWAPDKHITEKLSSAQKSLFSNLQKFEQLLSTINLKRLLSLCSALEFSLKQARSSGSADLHVLPSVSPGVALVLTVHPVPASAIKADVCRGREGQGSRL